MNWTRKIDPQWPLRIGLGVMFMWSGFDMFQHPTSWTWAVPNWFGHDFLFKYMSVETYFHLQGSFEFLSGLLFLIWILPRTVVKYLALISSLEIAGILFLGRTGIDSITFRDFGVLGAAFGLFILLARRETPPPPSVSS